MSITALLAKESGTEEGASDVNPQLTSLFGKKRKEKKKDKVVDIQAQEITKTLRLQEEKRKAAEDVQQKILDKRHKDSATVFVGNVPLDVKKKEFKKIWKAYGSVRSVRYRSVAFDNLNLPKKASFIQKKFHPSRKSCNAYVVFATKEEAQAALQANNYLLNGFHLRVDLMKPTKDYKRTVFVGNLPFDIDEESVRKHFDVCGEVEAVRLIRDKTTGIGKGFGYVTFHLKESVDDAIAMAGTKLNRRTLRVFKAKKNPTATGNVSRNDAAIVRRRKAGTERFEGRRASKPSKKTAKTIKMKRKRSLSSSNKPKHKKKRQRHG